MRANRIIQLPNKGRSGQSTSCDLSAEILKTYTRRKAVFGHPATSTASNTLVWNPMETLSAENPNLWEPQSWIARPDEQLRFHLETRSPSRSRVPVPQPSSVAELILNVRERSKSPFAERLARRLDQLVETSREEYPYQAPLSPQSLRDFIDFLQSVPNPAYPNVVLTPNGNIRAEWRKTPRQHFGVEFLGDSNVRFVVFAQDPKHPERTTRVSGLTSADNLLSIVQPYRVFDWVSKQAMAA